MGWYKRKARLAGLCFAGAALLFCSLARTEGLSAPGNPGGGEMLFTLEGVEGFSGKDGQVSGGGTSLWDKAGENLRFNIDLVSQFEITRRRGEPAWRNAAGVDIHKVFSDRRGDIGTAVLQSYYVRRDNALPVPAHVEDDDDWELEFHDFYFNLTRWGRGRANLKLGHFDLPFGLEPTVDTHQRVRQLIPGPNLGMKKDWGLSLNGDFPRFDYELSFTRGSGAEYVGARRPGVSARSADRNYAFAGRIGSPSDRNLFYGLSGFYGQVLNPRNDLIIRRVRGGVDAGWVLDQFTLLGEASLGRNFDFDVFNTLVELDWISPYAKWKAWLQGIYLGRESAATNWDEQIMLRLGGECQITGRWSASSQFSYDLEKFAAGPSDSKFILQTRYYF